MIVPHHRLENLFGKVKQLQDEARNYLIAGDRYVLRVEEIHKLVAQMYGLRIEKFLVASKAISLQSVVLRYDDGRAQILVRLDLPDPTRRFCVVKELCHLMLDEREDWSPDGVGTIKGLIRTFRIEVAEAGLHEPENDVMICEYLAEYAATELLYPFGRRRSDISELENGQTTLPKLALRYDVPPRVIRMALEKSYLHVCSEMYGTIPI